MGRYDRNKGTISIEEQEILKNSRVCILGCGGIGGYIIEELARVGIGFITAVDQDKFEDSNLNRQLLSNMKSLGMSKAAAAKERILDINPEINVCSVEERFDESNALKIIKDNDVVMDALDNIESRFLLQSIAEKSGIPFVHGAIAGWYGQVSTVLPGDRTLDKIYPVKNGKGIETNTGNPSFTPAVIASIQAAEAVKLLLKKGELLSGKILYINLLDHEFTMINFK